MASSLKSTEVGVPKSPYLSDMADWVLHHSAKEDEEDKVGVDGTMAYLQELGLNLEDASILVPLEIIQAPFLAQMSKEGFVEGWKAIGCVYVHVRSGISAKLIHQCRYYSKAKGLHRRAA